MVTVTVIEFTTTTEKDNIHIHVCRLQLYVRIRIFIPSFYHSTGNTQTSKVDLDSIRLTDMVCGSPLKETPSRGVGVPSIVKNFRTFVVSVEVEDQ